MPLYRIENKVWEFPASDVKRFGLDPEILKIRSKKGRVLFIRISGEWMRLGGASLVELSESDARRAEEAISLPAVRR